MQQCIKILLFLILNEAQHVSGDTPPIIRSLKLHKQALVLHTWKAVGRAVVGRPTTFHVCKTRGCLCSFRLLMMGGVSPETCWASFKIRNNKLWYTVASCWVFHCESCYERIKLGDCNQDIIVNINGTKAGIPNSLKNTDIASHHSKMV